MSLEKTVPTCPWISSVFTLLASLVAAACVYYVYATEDQRYQQQVRSETLEELSKYRTRIEQRVSGELRLFTGLAVQLAHNPELSEGMIKRTVNALIQDAPLVRSVGISDGYIVKYVFPYQGNEAAIGLNYLANPAQKGPILRAVTNKQPVLAGPVELVQGGQGLLGRLPVFVEGEFDTYSDGELWGIISIIFDMDRLYRQVGITPGQAAIDIAIRGTDGKGMEGSVFFGAASLFDTDNPRVSISLPGGEWVLTAAPNAKLLNGFTDRRSVIIYMGIVLILLCAIAAYMLSRQFQQQRAIISMQQESKAQILHAATYDRLTNMPNRYLFSEELEHQIIIAQNQQHILAVLFLDLDRFKDINDSFGHQVGDLFLKNFAQELLSNIRETEFVARIGGDEFAIIATAITDVEEAANLARRITAILNKPFHIQNNTLSAGLSIGIALYPQDGNSPTQLLQNADLAMYNAKQDPLSSCAFYAEFMNREVQKRKALISDIRNALQEDGFSLVYQPVVDIQNNNCLLGVETLCRWHHPTRGTVSPAVFIPAAEMSGLIVPLGQWIMEQAGRESASWEIHQHPNFTLSINMSPIQFHRGDPVKMAEQMLIDTGLPPHCLDIEITESAIMEDIEKAIMVVNQLRERGISVSIDDFGTGYSSLSRLRYLPVNRIKIDISFVRQIGKDRHSEAIIKAIMFLSNTLDIRTTAEGVETQEQLDFLRALGCNEVQGFYFYRPLDSTMIEDMLNRQKT